METGRGRCMDGPGNWLTKWCIICINTSCTCSCSWRCNGLELCSRRISCFHAFWCFPANPSNFSHCKCFSIRIPFLFQYKSIIFYVQVEHQEAVEEAVEFQDRTRVLLLLFIIIMLNYFIIIIAAWLIVYCTHACRSRIRCTLKCSVAKAGGLTYNYANGRSSKTASA